MTFMEETFAEVGARMARALRTIAAAHPGREIVVVSHGDPISAGILMLTGEPIADLHRRRLRTGDMVALDVSSEGTLHVEAPSDRGSPRLG